MERFILNYRKKIIGFMVFGLVFAFCFGPLYQISIAQETESDDVVVTATVQAWLNFAIDDLAPTLTPDLVASDGSTAIGTASSTLTLGTNSSDGWHIQVQGINDGLLHTDVGNTHNISTVTGRSELIAGTDGYGITIEDLNALGGPTLNVLTNYVDSGNFVGEVPSTSPVQVVNYDDPHANADVANLNIRAAALSTTPSGDYSDTITITATTGQI